MTKPFAFVLSEDDSESMPSLKSLHCLLAKHEGSLLSIERENSDQTAQMSGLV